jgi:SAM-dependent methyltransferase
MADPSHVLDRCGLAALSDLEAREWKDLFAKLESEQTDFLSHERDFRSADYKWPRDPLHAWSRIWEYPYVYHHLARLLSQANTAPLRAVDVGSGVTFFPFSLARLGYHVTCTDIDPICERDLPQAVSRVPHQPGTIDFKLSDGSTLPFADGEIDVVYCISVLEHVPEFTRLVREIRRILRPGGLFVLTVDIDLWGDGEIGPTLHRRLVSSLKDHFREALPDTTIHPRDALTTESSPYPLIGLSGVSLYWHRIKQHMIKPLLGRPPAPPVPRLAVQAWALKPL